MTITVLSSQTFMDIAIQHTGSVYNAFAIAVANGMAVSDSPISGSFLSIPESIVRNDDVLTYYKSNGIRPATALADENILVERRGIGWMKVGNTFKLD
ncbi:hypothetical protein [Chryseobacterium sp.]|uniref:hypothetical protein n=1 Tax=Chryseobacterium sp. TaxID=1871047 RepID=UPI00289D0741|nr:hypothetical protein [Chryseobacterium sp.]